MAARKRLLPPLEETSASSYEAPNRKGPEFHTCNFLIEAVSPEFDPNRVLLQRVFFNNEKTIYVSIGFYPARNYQPLVEFGGSKIKLVLLADQYVATMADCPPRIWHYICDNEQYGRSDGSFRLNTTGSYRVTRLYMDKYYVALKFQELRYLQNMFHISQTQLTSYIAALPDVMTYVISALSSTTYVEPAANASNVILYPRLFEEFKQYCNMVFFCI